MDTDLSFSKAVCGLVLLGLFLGDAAIAQIPNPTGENELFEQYIEEFSSRRSTLGLHVKGTSTLNNRYSQNIYASEVGSFAEFGSFLKGEFIILDNLVVHFYFPFLLRTGFVEDTRLNLPGFDFKARVGAGDMSTGVSWDILTERFSRLNLVTQVDLVIPTGRSRFDDLSEDDLPLGNGFFTLNLGLGISRSVLAKYLLFANGGYAKRFSRNFENSFISGPDLDPEDVKFIRAGVGYLFRKNIMLSFEFEHTDVGAVIEPPLDVENYFIKVNQAGETEKASFVVDLYLGLQSIDGENFFAFGFDIPWSYNVFNHHF